MVVAITTISVLLVLLIFLVGGIIGWLANKQFSESFQPYIQHLHPEMFDKNGNILPDEIISVHFEGVDLNDDDTEEEDNETCN